MILMGEHKFEFKVDAGKLKPFVFNELLAWIDENCLGGVEYFRARDIFGFAFEEDIDAMAMVAVFG